MRGLLLPGVAFVSFAAVMVACATSPDESQSTSGTAPATSKLPPPTNASNPNQNLPAPVWGPPSQNDGGTTGTSQWDGAVAPAGFCPNDPVSLFIYGPRADSAQGDPTTPTCNLAQICADSTKCCMIFPLETEGVCVKAALF